MTGLDPERTHSLIITNAEDQLLAVGLINTTSVSGDLMQVPSAFVTHFEITYTAPFADQPP